MTRTARTWAVFSLCAAAVLGALGWITCVALGLERREMAARGEAQLQETLRLALWRMDSALAPVIARESARPYFHYAALYPEEVAWNRVLTNVERGQVLLPSPLLREKFDFFLLHFQIDPDGLISSPQAPVGEVCAAVADNRVATCDDISRAQDLLIRLKGLVTRESLQEEVQRASWVRGCVLAAAAGPGAAPQPRTEQQWEAQGRQEFNVRQQRADVGNLPQAAQPAKPEPAKQPVEQGAFLPVWRAPVPGGEPQLFLVRSVREGGRETLQGIWTDWPKLRTWLLGEVRDLLPVAGLVPATAGAHVLPARLLANVPAVLEPGPPREVEVAGLTPLRASLLLAWGATLLAVAAVGVVLGAAMELGERRGRFVSAVTHELRTPLTTFRLYSQMLADGMVGEETARREYLVTLKEESERLSRVVENVLLYARVEARAPLRRGPRPAPLSAAELLREISPALTQRAAAGGRELILEVSGEAEAAPLLADPRAVEQILLNLIDNSSKYAAGAADRRLHLEARLGRSRLEMLYRDHGPGIPPGEGRNVFTAFRRAARDAAGPAPGVGLGLTLAREMARQMGGDLRLLEASGGGAAFLVSLPLAKSLSKNCSGS